MHFLISTFHIIPVKAKSSASMVRGLSTQKGSKQPSLGALSLSRCEGHQRREQSENFGAALLEINAFSYESCFR